MVDTNMLIICAFVDGFLGGWFICWIVIKYKLQRHDLKEK